MDVLAKFATLFRCLYIMPVEIRPKNLSYLKHNNIHYILKKLWIGSRTTKIMTANEKTKLILF